MGNPNAEGQAANILPPRSGLIFAVGVDATSRAYDLSVAALEVALGGLPITKGGTLYLTMRCTARMYFRFSSVTGTVDETAKDAAGAAPLTLRANACLEAAADELVHVRLDRALDKFLLVKGAAAGDLRFWISSELVGRTG